MTEVLEKISSIKAKVDNQTKPLVSHTITSTTNTTTTSGTSSQKSQKQTVKPKVSNLANSSAIVAAAAANSSTSCSSGFGGMKKGFLSGGLDCKKSVNKSPQDNKAAAGASTCDMPYVKSNPSNHLVMQEVQRMREQLQKTGEWMCPFDVIWSVFC